MESNDATNSLQDIEIDYSVASESADVSNVVQADVVTFGVDTDNDGTVDNSATVSGVSASNNGETLTISSDGNTNLNSGDDVLVTVNNVQNPANGGSYTTEVAINTQSTDNPSTATLSINPTSSIALQQDNDPDDDPQDQWDARLTSSGGPYWQGSDLVIKVSSQQNSQLQLREADDTDNGEEVGSFVSDLSMDGNGEAIVDTSNREGDYVVTQPGGSASGVYNFESGIAQDDGTTVSDSGGSSVDAFDGNGLVRAGSIDNTATEGAIEAASFEVTVQSLSASFKDTEISQERTFIELNSNRAGYVTTVTADGLDGDELENLFAAEIDTDGDDIGEHSPESNSDGIGVDDSSIARYDGAAFTSTAELQLTGNSSPNIDDDTIAFRTQKENANISLNFSEVETGDYTLNFEVADTDASASDSISNTEEEDVNAEILQPIARAGEGDNAAIPIQLENTDTATVNVGYNDVNFNLTFDIEDGNDDDVVTAGIDLYTVGRGDLGAVPGDVDAETALSISNGSVNGNDAQEHTLEELVKFANANNIDLTEGPYAQLVEDADGDGDIDLDNNDFPSRTYDDRLRQSTEQTYYSVNALAVTPTSVEPADDDDTISNVNLTAIPGSSGSGGDIFIDDPPLDNADYDINVTDGGITGQELAVGTMDVTETVNDGLRTWTMSRNNYNDLDSDVEDARSEIYASIGDTLTEDDTIAERDVMVFQYRGTGFFGGLAAAKDDGEDYDEAFVELMRGDISGQSAVSGENYNYAGAEDGLEVTDAYVGDFDFRVEQQNPVANRNGKSLDLAETALQNNGMRVVPDQANSSLFIFIDEQEANMDRNEAQDRAAANQAVFGALDDVDDVGRTDLSMQDGEEYTANLSIADGALNNDGVIVADSDFTVVEKELTYDTNAQDIIQVSAQSGQTISGSTTVAPGTELDLRIRSTGESPFLRSPQPVVQADGSFNASVDFSTVAENTSFTASARGFDDEDTPGVVGEAPVAQVRIDDQSGDGTTVTVRSVTMSEGGFVAIHSVTEDGGVGPVIGNSEYLSEGQSTGVEVTLDEPLSDGQQVIAMPHLDTNGNQQYDFPQADSPYTANGSAVTDSAQYTIATPTPTTDTTTEPPTTTTEPPTTTEEPDTAEPTDEPGTTAPPETTTTGGPGFTAGIALVALAAAALLALRRRD
ncbi:DUF7282 domain-containing protein [Halorientalis marina]|uniref:DUF7282 domain-containing protein n=1 Tax=Halorientalis marina TaxID=2931976 RepID=UPI001FF325AB|nr:BGTF surface domain-containing protein [Halorientalis marina]